MKILVTGGAGYIGSHTITEALSNGHDVTVFDDFSTGSIEALHRVQRMTKCSFEIIRGDIRDERLLRKSLNRVKPDAIIHFAGLKSVEESVTDPLSYYDINLAGSLALLRAMDKQGCQNLVFSSSATVYGVPVNLPLDETHPTAPINPYGHSKLMVEQIIQDWVTSSPDRSAVALRYFNPVGAHPTGQIGESTIGTPKNLMPFAAQVAIGRRSEVTIFGDDYDTRDGTGERDYIHIMDLAEAHLASLEFVLNETGFNVFNLGTGDGVTVKELVAEIGREFGTVLQFRVLERRAGDVARAFSSSLKANNQLNWVAKRNLAEMCRDHLNWQRKNPNGY